VQLLIDAGADTQAKDGKGRTAQDMAASYQWHEIVNVLEVSEV
jgi:ankyrin repeat protein